MLLVRVAKPFWSLHRVHHTLWPLFWREVMGKQVWTAIVTVVMEVGEIMESWRWTQRTRQMTGHKSEWCPKVCPNATTLPCFLKRSQKQSWSRSCRSSATVPCPGNTQAACDCMLLVVLCFTFCRRWTKQRFDGLVRRAYSLSSGFNCTSAVGSLTGKGTGLGWEALSPHRGALLSSVFSDFWKVT